MRCAIYRNKRAASKRWNLGIEGDESALLIKFLCISIQSQARRFGCLLNTSTEFFESAHVTSVKAHSKAISHHSDGSQIMTREAIRVAVGLAVDELGSASPKPPISAGRSGPSASLAVPVGKSPTSLWRREVDSILKKRSPVLEDLGKKLDRFFDDHPSLHRRLPSPEEKGKGRHITIYKKIKFNTDVDKEAYATAYEGRYPVLEIQRGTRRFMARVLVAFRHRQQDFLCVEKLARTPDPAPGLDRPYNFFKHSDSWGLVLASDVRRSVTLFVVRRNHKGPLIFAEVPERRAVNWRQPSV